jgi:hypothetical protein
MSIVNDLLTGKDGESHDIGRWSWAVSIFSVISAAGWNAVHAGVVDLVGFSQAIGAIVLAHGGALFVKAKTEPDPPGSPK